MSHGQNSGDGVTLRLPRVTTPSRGSYELIWRLHKVFLKGLLCGI